MQGINETEQQCIATIARFDETKLEWAVVGQMKLARAGHGVIYDGQYFVVVGGSNQNSRESMITERCYWSNQNMTCEQQQPELDFYEWYPELFLVHDDYVEDC